VTTPLLKRCVLSERNLTMPDELAPLTEAYLATLETLLPVCGTADERLLLAEVKRLSNELAARDAVIRSFADRIKAQSDILARRAL
jgi:hypothetical protein